VTGAAERIFSYATYFESNMILQMAPARASVWGYAASSAVGETVVVSLSSSINVNSYTTTVVPGNDLHFILGSLNQGHNLRGVGRSVVPARVVN